MAGLALLVAICLTVARGAFGQNNFYGISEDFATPPAVRDARERDPTAPLRAGRNGRLRRWLTAHACLARRD